MVRHCTNGGMGRSALVVFVSIMSVSAWACSPGRGWTPPTPESAFQSADVVVHAHVLSQTLHAAEVKAKIQVIDVLKGDFTDDFVVTRPSSACGIGKFVVGREYVFFLRGNGRFVSYLNQPPRLSARDTLYALGRRDRQP